MRKSSTSATVVPGVRFAVDSYVTFARTWPWIEGVASSLTELFAPAAMAARTVALRQHYLRLDHDALGYAVVRQCPGCLSVAEVAQASVRCCSCTSPEVSRWLDLTSQCASCRPTITLSKLPSRSLGRRISSCTPGRIRRLCEPGNACPGGVR